MASIFSFFLLFGLIALITNYCAWKNGFFHLQELGRAKWVNFTLPTVLLYFFIYIGASYILAITFPYWMHDLAAWLNISLPLSEAGYNAVFQLVHSLVLIVFLALFSLTQDSATLVRIFKDKQRKVVDPLYKDFFLGVLTWLVAFPLVVLISEASDLLLGMLFGPIDYEQNAVVYLKSAQEVSWIALIAFFGIVLIAPVMEEFLFRGVLQSYLKKKLGVRSAIIFTALIFALFHVSASQGYGNISLVSSLFIFALFLGFIYERQGSLLASIGLHMTFNTISTLRIVFAPDF